MKIRLLLVPLLFCSFGNNLYAQGWSQQAKIVANDRDEDDGFGYSVAIDGSWVLVGAPEDENDTTSSKVDRNGSAYLYHYSNGQWKQTQKINSKYRRSPANFGCSVDLDGKQAVIGARYEEDDANWGNNLNNAGAAYIFENNNGKWKETQKLCPNDRKYEDQFGFSVAISGDFLIVGAPTEDEDANGKNFLSQSGSAYIFKKTNGVWKQYQKLVATDRRIYDNFGTAVDINGDYAVIGARNQSYDASGKDSIRSSGAAYIFKNVNGKWTQIKKLVASSRRQAPNFGNSVAISDDWALVGANFEDYDAQEQNKIQEAGAAYIYGRNKDQWTFAQKITPKYRVDGQFGISLGIDGDELVVGAMEDNLDTLGNKKVSSGAAFIFSYENSKWVEKQKLYPKDGATRDYFGYSVGISDHRFVSGASFEDDDENDSNYMKYAGSTYIFEEYIPCQTTYASDTITACDSMEFFSRKGWWGKSGSYRDTLVNAEGCDSIISLELTILNSTSSSVKVTACDSMASPSAKYVWKVSGNYKDTILNKAGCDSVISFSVTINHASSSSNKVVACDSVQSPSKRTWWQASGMYTDTLANKLGCDSLINWDLVIHKTKYSSPEFSTCDTLRSPSGKYLWNKGGTFLDTIKTEQGCDSILEVKVHVLLSTDSVNITTCRPYVSPSGRFVWTTSGVYSDTIPNRAGCDSLITVTLSVESINLGVTIGVNKLTADLNGVQYSWLDCNDNYVVIPGETGQEFNPTKDGNYAVDITTDYCRDTTNCYQISLVGIANIMKNKSVQVYPNPTDGVLHLDCRALDEVSEAEVTDLYGRIISRHRVKAGEINQIALTGTKGLYIIRLRNENEVLGVVRVEKNK